MIMVLDISIGLFSAGVLTFGIFTGFRRLVPVDTALTISLLLNLILAIVIKIYR